MRQIILVGFFTLMYSCGIDEQTVATSTSVEEEVLLGYEVEYAGALKKIMHESDVSAYADLRDLKDKKNVYAVGAVEGLKGEVLILKGQPYVSMVEDSHLVIHPSFDYKASLLVHTEIAEWSEMEVDTEIRTYDELESFVAMAAEERGVDVTVPFPFLLSGSVDSLYWHVIDWPVGDTIHTHEKHIQSGLSGIHENQEVEVLGFYSDSHHAIFTHHTTNMHLHFISKDRKQSGHVDDLLLGEGMTLYLPKIE